MKTTHPMSRPAGRVSVVHLLVVAIATLYSLLGCAMLFSFHGNAVEGKLLNASGIELVKGFVAVRDTRGCPCCERMLVKLDTADGKVVNAEVFRGASIGGKEFFKVSLYSELQTLLYEFPLDESDESRLFRSNVTRLLNEKFKSVRENNLQEAVSLFDKELCMDFLLIVLDDPKISQPDLDKERQRRGELSPLYMGLGEYHAEPIKNP